ncbi:hypothetical protein B0H14DRAFT_3144189 [Mycena olivaceomarginata]|nr:hypothetical protein B0H14DRAFT_3144189 [Mycena olivaceomarginata]
MFPILKGFFRTTSVREWPLRVAQPFDSRRNVGPPSSPDSLDGDRRTTFATGSLLARVPALPALSAVNTRPYKRPLNKHQETTLIIQLKGTAAFLGRPSAHQAALEPLSRQYFQIPASRYKIVIRSSSSSSLSRPEHFKLVKHDNHPGLDNPGQSSIFKSILKRTVPHNPWHTTHIDAMDAATSAQDQFGNA